MGPGHSVSLRVCHFRPVQYKGPGLERAFGSSCKLSGYNVITTGIFEGFGYVPSLQCLPVKRATKAKSPIGLLATRRLQSFAEG
jgi:hypothetical protein